MFGYVVKRIDVYKRQHMTREKRSAPRNAAGRKVMETARYGNRMTKKPAGPDAPR